MRSCLSLLTAAICLYTASAEAFNIKVRNKFENVQFEPIDKLYSNMADKEFIFDSKTTYKKCHLLLLSPNVSGELVVEISNPSISLVEGLEYKILKNQELVIKLVVASFKGTEFVVIKDKPTGKALLNISLKGSTAKSIRQRTTVNVENDGTVRLYHDVRYNHLMVGAGIRGRSDSVGSDLHISYEW